MIKAKGLSKEYFPGETLFKGVEFVMSKGEKIALTGPNGCGKTTLFKILLGVESKTEGGLFVENERIGYLPQELDLPFEKSVGEFVSGMISGKMLKPPQGGARRVQHNNLAEYGNGNDEKVSPLADSAWIPHQVRDDNSEVRDDNSEVRDDNKGLLRDARNDEGLTRNDPALRGTQEGRVGELMSRFSLNNVAITSSIGTLSGGEQMKLKLIEVLLANPTFLLLDEPTNHLDIDGILWFEKFINEFDGGVLMISHDRSFINNTVSKVFELENGEFHIYVGNYDAYQLQKSKFIEKKNEEYVRFLKKKKQLEELLVLAHKIGGSNPGAVAAAKSRYNREIEQNKKEKYTVEKVKDLAFSGGTHEGKLIVSGENVVKSFGGRAVLNGVDFEIRGREKVWLYGPNGTGKSTLVKLIYSKYDEGKMLKQIQHDKGEVQHESMEGLKLGKSLRIGYFAQSNEPMNLNLTVFDYFKSETAFDHFKAYGVLEKFLFDKSFCKHKLKTLSPGQRARLKLAVFSVGEYDFLILDEPTNHLDIASKEVVEGALRDYEGALLLVSHDRYFVSEVGVEKVFELRGGKLSSRWV